MQKNIFKYQHLVSLSTREEVILRELRTMVDFALWTPLQDERVAGAPLEAVAKLLDEPSAELDGADARTSEETLRERRSWAEAVLSVVAPLLEKAAPPATLARVLARLTQQHPRSQLVPMLSPAITRCLKHTVDFGKSPDMRKLLQVGILPSDECVRCTCLPFTFPLQPLNYKRSRDGWSKRDGGVYRSASCDVC